MDQDPFKKKEVLNIKIEKATVKDWEAYKKLRLEAIEGPDREMFGSTLELIQKEQARTEEEWKTDLSSGDMFVFLVRNNADPIGFGIVTKESEVGAWRLRSGYMQKDFRSREERIGKQLFEARLNQVKKMGATKARLAVKAHNATSIHIAESFGFKKVEKDASPRGFFMELDLTKNKDTV